MIKNDIQKNDKLFQVCAIFCQYTFSLKIDLKKESEVVTNCNRLKFHARDGKIRETNTADVETIYQPKNP